MSHVRQLNLNQPAGSIRPTRLWCEALFFLLLGVFVCLVPGTGQASSVPYDDAGIYSATTDDNITIMLYRYRPEPSAAFRTNGTPVLLFSGIVQNMNQYLACTPEEMRTSYSRMELPESIADWALAKDASGNPVSENGQPVLEKYIRADNLRYYSLAHYLWLKGYDPWFANYRDTGRLTMHSDGEHDKTLDTLDTWATLDVSAAIAKVRQVTGKRLYIGGHSTGGLVCYAYLQGTYLDYDGQADKAAVYQAAAKAGYQRHVKGDPLLALERNNDIKGFIAIDPAGRPPLPDALDSIPMWLFVGSRFYVPMDDIAQNLVQLLPAELVMTFETVLFGGINTLDQLAITCGLEDNLFGYLDFWYASNTDPYIGDFIARYATSGFSLRCFGGYMDNGLNNTTREFWMNGSENKDKIRGPAPDPGKDSYYYYSQYMSRMTVPMIACLSDSGSLVDPLNVYEDIISKKTASPLDEWYVITGTGHFDIANGRKTPGEVFPKIGAWLDKVEALDQEAQEESESTTDTDASQETSGSSHGGCFITSALL